MKLNSCYSPAPGEEKREPVREGSRHRPALSLPASGSRASGVKMLLSERETGVKSATQRKRRLPVSHLKIKTLPVDTFYEIE